MPEKLIIGIHGLANKPKPETLALWWKKSIAEGLDKNEDYTKDFEFKMVYWADLLYVNPLHTLKAYNFDTLFNEEPYKAAKKDALVRYKDSFKDDVRAFAGKLLGAGLDSIKERFGVDALADRVLEKTLRDLKFYYDPNRKIANDKGKMVRARTVLRNKLRKSLLEESGKQILLISHSMGTIIAYDVLRKIGQSKKDNLLVAHFVTIGSPLGLPHVKGKIIDECKHDSRVRTPSIVTKSWTNFADPRDPVALDSHLRDDYEANAKKVRVRDDLIKNDFRAPGRRANPHKSYGYLRTPEVSEHIAAFLR